MECKDIYRLGVLYTLTDILNKYKVTYWLYKKLGGLERKYLEISNTQYSIATIQRNTSLGQDLQSATGYNIQLWTTN